MELFTSAWKYFLIKSTTLAMSVSALKKTSDRIFCMTGIVEENTFVPA